MPHSSPILHEYEIPAPIHPTAFGAEKMMLVREARDTLACWDGRLPEDFVEVSNIASAHFVLGNEYEALRYATIALGCNRNPSTLLNVAVILETYGRFVEAAELSREAWELDPADPYAGGLYSDALLRLGRWTEAWPIYVDHHANWTCLRPVIPEWDGHFDLHGKRLLVLDGGGYGDNIFFFRWLPWLRSLGPHLTLRCPPLFASLVREYPFIDRTLGGYKQGAAADIIPHEYDCFVSLLALGYHFRATVESYQWEGPYLHGNRDLGRRLVGSCNRRMKIGFCWQAGEHVSPRKHRTLFLEHIERIIGSRTDVDWVNLAYGTSSASMFSPSISDWHDTASALTTLDLLVTVDTGLAHLAGAMNVPVWVVLPGISAWQYLLDSDRHPLYPSMRLFRNHGVGIDFAVNSACDALRDWRPSCPAS